MTQQPSPTSVTRPRSAVVVGGGLAGIAAAVRLAERGVCVTLVESRNRLGGRATSFVDPQSGQVLDNCQHVLMGCCTNLIDLYERLGVADRIAWHDRFHFIDNEGHHDILKGDPLPAPMHLGRSLMRFKSLAWEDKKAIARGMYAMMRLGPAGREAWHERPFSEWLREAKQTPRAIEKFWSNVIVSALNEQPDNAAADYALQVFQDGFLAHRRAFLMGLANVPLLSLYETAEQVIARAGGRVLFSTSAKDFHFNGENVTAVRIGDDETMSGDAYVTALPFDRLARMCAPQMSDRDERLSPRALSRFKHSPIIGIHLWMKRRGGADAPPVMPLPHVSLTQSKLHWVFNKGYDAEVGGDHLHGVISAAYELIDEPAETIVDMAVSQVRAALPTAREAQVVHSRVIKEKLATFSVHPGVDALRPPARGAIGNLFLAGDWCQSGWPATMEGAVRSGYIAASAALGEARDKALVDDLPASALCRWLRKPSPQGRAGR